MLTIGNMTLIHVNLFGEKLLTYYFTIVFQKIEKNDLSDKTAAMTKNLSEKTLSLKTFLFKQLQ